MSRLKKNIAKEECQKMLALANTLLMAKKTSRQWDDILKKQNMTLTTLLTDWNSMLKVIHRREKNASKLILNYQPEDSLLSDSVESIHQLVLAILDDDEDHDPQKHLLYRKYSAVLQGIGAWARVVDLEPMNEKPAWRSERLFQALPMLRPLSPSRVQQNGSSTSSSSSDVEKSSVPHAEFVELRILVYKALLLCWSRTKTVEGPKRTRYWLERMKEEQEILGIANFVDIDCYNRVLAAYAHQGILDQVEEISKEITRLEKDGKLEVDAVSYDLLVEAYQRYPAPNDESRLRMAAAAHFIYLEMLSKYEATKNIKLKPLVITLGRILTLYGKDPDKGRQILYHALEFEESHREEFLRADAIDSPFLVDASSIQMLMHAFVKMNRVEDAEELVILSMEKHDAGYSHLQPTRNTAEIIMNGYAQRCDPDCNGSRSGTSALESLSQVERILQVMEDRLLKNSGRKIDISVAMYNILMSSYLKTKAKIDKIEKIEGTIDKMTQQALHYQRPDLGPDVSSFTILLKALIHQKNRSFEKIDNVLLRMQTSPRRSARPNHVTIKLLAQSYLTTSDARFLERALALFDQTKLIDESCFHYILMGYERQGRAREALVLLDRMIKESKESKNNRCRPKSASYSYCLGAIARSNMPGKWSIAKDLFERMLGSYKNGDWYCEPNNQVVAVLLRVLRDSDEPVDKVKEALEILRELDSRFLDTSTLEAFILTCSKADGQRESLKDAFMAAYQAFYDFQKPMNSSVYIAMLNACNELLQNPEQRKNAIAKLFRHCAASGLVNKEFLGALWKMCPPDDYTDLTLQDATLVPIIQSIPHSWKRRVT